MREKSKEGLLDKDEILSIMREEKPNQAAQFKMPQERISEFFKPGTPNEKIQDTIIKALDYYQRHLERQRGDAR
jgi:ParB family chromosome partitioning protein